MFAAVYQFVVKENQTDCFTKAWKELTQLIYQYENSLGSRLHQYNENTFIAYAQWPDRRTWEKSGNLLPDDAKIHRQKMRESCVSITTVYELEMTEDLLATSPFN